MEESTVDLIKIVSAMLMFIIALSLAIYLFIRIKKNSQMTITSKRWTITGKSVVNIYRVLIFLGIILITFFIVMLCMIIYNNTYGTTEEMLNSSKEQVSNIHNLEFENYFGNNVSGTYVKALMQKIQINNRQATSDNEEVGNYIYVRLDGININDYSSIKSGQRYAVNSRNDNKANNKKEFGTEFWKNGYLKSIEITTINK